MSSLKLLSLLSLLSFQLLAIDWAGSINIAGRQRMLSQRMAKEYALVVLGVEAEANKGSLKKTSELFSSSLKSLKAEAPNNAIKNQLDKVDSSWKNYQADLVAYSKDKLATVYKTSLLVLRYMNRAVKLYEKAAAQAGVKAKGKMINKAGRQRMLTQKMSKEAFFIALGFDVKGTNKDLKKTHALFEKSHGELVKSAPADVKAQLAVVEGLWKKFSPHIQKVLAGDTSKETLTAIASSNVPLLKDMNKAVGMYK